MVGVSIFMDLKNNKNNSSGGFGLDKCGERWAKGELFPYTASIEHCAKKLDI